MVDVSVTIRRLNGQQLSISVASSCSIANLHGVVHAALGLKKSEAIKLSFGVTALELGHSESTLQTVGINDGDEVSVAILSELRVHRHIYRAGGGAPPWRTGNLVSTEEVCLNCSLPLREQWEALVPNGDYIHLMTTKEGAECSYCDGQGSRVGSHGGRCENCEGAGKLNCAPKLWCEANKDENQLSPYEARTAGEVFEERNSVGIVCLLRGTD